MGNYQFGYNFVTYTPTASTSATAYPDDNLLLARYPLRKWAATVATNTTIVGNMTSAHALSGIVLVDCNFTACYLQGNATDVWTAPSWRYPAVSGNLTISKDERTQRYNVFIPTSGFNYQYFRLYIVTQTPTDGTVFRIGSMVALDTVLTLNQNPSYGANYSADEPMTTNGCGDDIVKGDKAWEGSFAFDKRTSTVEADFWTLNSIGKSGLMTFYENGTDTSKVYVCRRRTAVTASWAVADLKNFERMTFQEVRNGNL